MNAVLYFERVDATGRRFPGKQCQPVGIFIMAEDGRTEQDAKDLLDAQFESPEGLMRVERVTIASLQMADSIGPIIDKIGPVYWENTLEAVLARLNLIPASAVMS